MLSLVLTKATIQQVLEVGIPFVSSHVKKWMARRRANARKAQEQIEQERGMQQTQQSPYQVTSARSRYFQEAKLPAYHSTIEDYGELIIQFGYLVLFGVAFPLAAVVNLINNLIEVRTDAFKILGVSQRVNADDAADVGAWYPILEFLNVLSVITNAGLLVFTGETGDHLFRNGKNLETVWKIVTFFVMIHCLFIIKRLASYCISDVPPRVYRKLAREKFDIARYFNTGWENGYRGSSLLQVGEDQILLCNKYADLFEQASDDGDKKEV